MRSFHAETFLHFRDSALTRDIRRGRPLALLLFCALAALPLAAQQKTQSRGRSAQFDIRDVESLARGLSGAGKSAPPSPAAVQIREAVEGFRTPDGLAASYSFGRFGLPKRLSAPGGALSLPQDASPREAAIAFLRANRQAFPFQADEWDAMTVAHETDAAGLHVVRLQQTLGGLPVYGGRLSIAVDRQGRVIQVAAGEAAPGLALGPQARLTAMDAAKRALRRPESPSPEALEDAGVSPNGRRLFRNPASPNLPAAAVDAVVFPLTSGEGRRAWRVLADTPGDRREVLIDAADGRLLRSVSLRRKLGSARVWTESPLSPQEVVAFPTGWLPEAGDRTSGNNVDAFVDLDMDSEPDPLDGGGLSAGRATADEAGFFDHAAGNGFDFDSDFLPAAATNAFYFANMAHDYFYALGFREADGAFQVSNGNRGGVAGDPMVISIQDLSLFSDTEILPGPDGVSAIMRLQGLLTADGIVHTAFEGDAVVHEYTHGVTDRLVGGADDVLCLGFGIQGSAISEGVSDYFAASFFDDPLFGEYVDSRGTGVRLAVMSANPRTFESLGDPYFEEHADGEIVAAILWQIRTAVGAAATDKIVFDALKLLPCEPSLVDLRDALLTAAGDARRTALWRIFAPRGLGMSARAEDFGLNHDTLFDAAFDLPPDLSTGNNRPPRFLGSPGDFAIANEQFIYTARAEDPNGDPITFRLLDGPEDAVLNATTGRLTYRGKFTSQRVAIEATDGRGGRTVHGLLIYGGSVLTPGRSLLISGDRYSSGLGLIIVDGAREAMQVTTRGGSGDTDLTVFGLLDDEEFYSERNGVDETITIPNPSFPVLWVIFVDGYEAYENVTFAASFIQSRAAKLDSTVSAPNGARTSETFYKINVPPGAQRLRVTATGGSGDADLFLSAGRLPVCAAVLGLTVCDSDFESRNIGNLDSIEVTKPAAGDWFLNLQGYRAFSGVTLTISTTASPVQLTGATDAASYGALIGSGGIGTLFGSGFTDQTLEAGTLPLPTELGGVRVYVDGVLAGLFYVSPTQINFQLPVGAGIGTVDIVVVKGAEVSQTLEAIVQTQVPRMFAFTLGDGSAAPVVTHADGSVVTPDNPAAPGEVLVAYLTGAAITPQPADGEAASADPLSLTVDPAEVTVGGAGAATLFSGATPGFVGLIQVNFQLPAALPPGSRLVLVIRFGDASTLPLSLPVGP